MKQKLPRIIPSLLYSNRGLVKTVRFSNPTYIGDPINAVKIYNEMEADELLFLDIDASSKNKPIDFNIIEEIANEAFMPVCYGGGIKKIEDIDRIISIGIEKVCISSSAIENLQLISNAAARFGSQSIVVCIDVLNSGGNDLVVRTMNGKVKTNANIFKLIEDVQNSGAGEIVISDINREGSCSGFDIPMLQHLREHVKIPLIATGGAGSLEHVREVVTKAHVDAVAAGSLFVYFGRIKGILINYPKHEKIKSLFADEVLNRA